MKDVKLSKNEIRFINRMIGDMVIDYKINKVRPSEEFSNLVSRLQNKINK